MKKKTIIGKSEKRQRSLQSNEDAHFLQTLIDTVPIPLFYKDTQGVYLGGNQAFADFLGLAKKDVRGKTVYDVAPRQFADRYAEADAELFRSGGVQTYESSAPQVDGTTRDVIFNKAVFLNSDGTVGGLVGSIFDITRRKEAKRELVRCMERYRRIFENIQDVYYEVGIDGTILEISPSIERYVPLRREELIGRSVNEFHIDREKKKELLKTIKDKGLVNDFEMDVKDMQGNPLTCSISAVILPGDDRTPPRMAGSLRDITERKRTEMTLRQREEELSIKSRNLEELNAALKVLLRHREEDRTELEERVLANVKTLALPCIERLKEGPLNRRQSLCLDILEAHIQKIISPFLREISQSYFDLTSQEIRVAGLVRDGKSTKDIAEFLGVSTRTVESHRDSIRRKLGIKDRKTSLRSFLLKLS